MLSRLRRHAEAFFISPPTLFPLLMLFTCHTLLLITRYARYDASCCYVILLARYAGALALSVDVMARRLLLLPLYC